MNEIKKSFPSDKQEALAMAYIQAQDLSGKTPEEVVAIYDDAYTRICKEIKNVRIERQKSRV